MERCLISPARMLMDHCVTNEKRAKRGINVSSQIKSYTCMSVREQKGVGDIKTYACLKVWSFLINCKMIMLPMPKY